jgi:hypothetical protein
MMGVYGLIGNLLAVWLAVTAFLQAAPKGRIAIAGLMAATFLVPEFVPGPTTAIICFVARILIAIGCYLYIRWENAV